MRSLSACSSASASSRISGSASKVSASFSGALRVAQLADAGDDRLDVGQLLGCTRIGLAGQAFAEHRPHSSARGAMRSSLREKLIGARDELRQRHSLLLARCQILELRHAPRDLRLAQDDGGPRAAAVRALHAALEIAAIGHLGADSGVAERLQHLDGGRFGHLSHRAPPRPARRRGRLAQQHRESLDSRRPSRRRASAGRPFPRPVRHTARPPARYPARQGGRSRTRTPCDS